MMRYYAFLFSLFAIPTSYAQSFDQISALLAESFYCGVIVTMAGDTGVLIGLAIAAFGFYRLIFSGPGLGNLLLIAGGVLFTAIPTWFEHGMDTLGSIFSSVGGSSTIVQKKHANSSIAECAALDQAARNLIELRTALQQQTQQQQQNAAGGVSGTIDTTAPGFQKSTGLSPGNTEAGNFSAANCSPFNASGLVASGGGCKDGFGVRGKHPITGKPANHNGIDFAAPIGTPIQALGDFEVIRFGNQFNQSSGTGFGNFIQGRYTSGPQAGTTFQVAHLNGLPSNISVGQSFSTGQSFAQVGSTGGSTGPHVDYSEQVNGRFVNPCGANGTGLVCN